MISPIRLRVRVGLALGLALLCLTAAARPAAPFALDSKLTRGTADPSDDLLAAARWSRVRGSLARDRVRGLGGGLEYSIAADFCTRLRPRFIDRPRPSCGRIRTAIADAFAAWSEGNDILNFVDVSGAVAPRLPPPGSKHPWRGYGAEIDIFAMTRAQYPRLKKVAAFTRFWYLHSKPRVGKGRRAPGVTITSADMVFSTKTCYHMDPALGGRRCNHFPSLVRHEIAHALALDHPNQNRRRNFDSDRNPHNRVSIDCDDPTRGLGLSPVIDPMAVANSSLGKPAPVRMRLTNDDLAGRDFLYPNCD